MNTSHKNGIKFFRAFLERHISAHNRTTYGEQVTRFEQKTIAENLTMVHAEVEMTSLDNSNPLRETSHEWWTVVVGPKGGITVKSCPRHFEQFYGKRAFGMLFEKQ